MGKLLETLGTAGIGAGISSVGSLVGGIIQGHQQRKMIQDQYDNSVKLMKRQFEQSKEMADYQNTINVENWERENSYNSPVEQKKRLEAAGYNTAALEGSLSGASSSVASNSGSITGSIPSLDYQAPASASNAVSNAIRAGADVFQSYAEAQLARSQTLTEETKQKLNVAEAESKSYLNSYHESLTNQINELTPGKKLLLDKEAHKLDAVIANEQKSFELICENIEGARTDRRLTERNIDKIPFEIARLVAEHGDLVASSVQRYSQATYNKALTAVAYKDVEFKDAQTALQKLYGDAQSIANYIAESTKNDKISLSIHDVLQARENTRILSVDSQYRERLHENTISVGDATRFYLYGQTSVKIFDSVCDKLFKVFGNSSNVKDDSSLQVGNQIIDGASCRALMKLAESGFSQELANMATSGFIF